MFFLGARRPRRAGRYDDTGDAPTRRARDATKPGPSAPSGRSPGPGASHVAARTGGPLRAEPGRRVLGDTRVDEGRGAEGLGRARASRRRLRALKEGPTPTLPPPVAGNGPALWRRSRPPRAETKTLPLSRKFLVLPVRDL